MAFNGLSVYQEGLDAFLGVIFVGDFDLVGCTSVLTGNGEAFHIRGDAGIYGQSVQGRIDAQDVLGNIDKGPGCRTGEPAVLRFAEVSGILSGYHLRVNIRLCPVDLTDVFNVGRAGLFIYFESTVSVADDSLADRDPGIVVTEDTCIFLVSGRIRGNFTQVEVIGGIRRLLKDNAVFGVQPFFDGGHGFFCIPLLDTDAGQYTEALGLDEDLTFFTFLGT